MRPPSITSRLTARSSLKSDHQLGRYPAAFLNLNALTEGAPYCRMRGNDNFPRHRADLEALQMTTSLRVDDIFAEFLQVH